MSHIHSSQAEQHVFAFWNQSAPYGWFLSVGTGPALLIRFAAATCSD